ncbi:UNVERIFIED_CONTAM: hypothetical protein FKN15_006201 [Acipenser sinensis]
MGKKVRTAPGRRPILQLSPPGPRSITTGGSNSREENPGSTSEDEQDGTGDGPIFIQSASKDIIVEAKPPAVKATEGLSLLGAYEDSDEEESPDSQPQPAKANHNQSGDIDSTLANFLAEIDAITTQPAQTPEESTADSKAPPPTPPRPEPKDQPPAPSHTAAPNGTEAATTGAEFQYDTQYSLSGVGVEMGHWQEVWDENSGCFYYWNTETNEVTWQLPLDLAHQVQGLQHYTDSSTMAVNGSSAQSAVFYPEQNPVISTTVQITKKESKKKEVMESVVALTSEEEERRGVAASLLAPLIPEEVKEAEERWRKKVVCLEEEGPGPEVEGQTVEHPAPTDVETRSHGDPRSNAHSGESSEGGENEEEAELRALEEGDGSLTGSSPRSDVSHEGSRVELLKKGKWKTTFVRSASPDSNSRSSEKTGRDSPDPPETATSKGNETPVEEDEMDTEALSEKTKPKVAQKEEEENVDLKTRIADWREGSLSGNYLKRKLQEAAEQIKHYEINATPKGWSCHWDRDHRRYFYVNDHTNASRWEFPDVEEEGVSDGKDMKMEQGSKDQGDPKPPADLLGIVTGKSSGYQKSFHYIVSENSSPDSNDSDVECDHKEGQKKTPYSLVLERALLRTRQLVFDFHGGKQVPRLREPRSLFAIPTRSGPLQPVHWPIECEVIKDKIEHIEWVPPEPEEFYHLTGYERTPMCVGDDRGNAVYSIDSAMKSFYFTFSRIGGCRGPIKEAVCPKGKDDSSLVFESRFESGNLQKAVRVRGQHDYELTLRTDLYTKKHTQWYYFRVQNMKPGTTYRFTIVNLMKSNSLYNLGLQYLEV